MTVDIDGNLKIFLSERAPDARYASFDYCFNHFQAAREAGTTGDLAKGENLLPSCLHLGFYLASWGMMRGSGDLLQRSVRELVPVVTAIAAEPVSTWDLDADSLRTNHKEVLTLSSRIRTAFSISASDTLVTKTMLGVFGCVPAFDRYFRIGFDCSTLCKRALVRIGEFYELNRAQIDSMRVPTIDFLSGKDTERKYSRSKVIDMVFFREGLNQESKKKQASQR